MLIIYYSNTGKTEKMASQITAGVQATGANAILKG
jgi:flavodoxin